MKYLCKDIVTFPFIIFQLGKADKGSIAQEGGDMEEITIEYREMVKKYCAFVNIKLDEALDGKSQLADIDIESMARTANTLVVTSKRVAENQPL